MRTAAVSRLEVGILCRPLYRWDGCCEYFVRGKDEAGSVGRQEGKVKEAAAAAAAAGGSV